MALQKPLQGFDPARFVDIINGWIDTVDAISD
jgi:hypothetical protein